MLLDIGDWVENSLLIKFGCRGTVSTWSIGFEALEMLLVEQKWWRHWKRSHRVPFKSSELIWENYLRALILYFDLDDNRPRWRNEDPFQNLASPLFLNGL